MLLYGVEIFAWNDGIDGYDSVAHYFYKRFLGLQKGTSGVVLELILGRESIRSRAVRRALLYWRKMVHKNEEFLVKEAVSEQSRDLQYSKQNWLHNVKKELNTMGLGFLWRNPERLGIKKF